LHQSTQFLTIFSVSSTTLYDLSQLTFSALVWGPEPVALGFVGAPLATAISFNLIAIASIVYGIYFIPRTAWLPFSRRSFTNLGVLIRLGLGGIGLCSTTSHSPTVDIFLWSSGQTASEWWSWELVGRKWSPSPLDLADKVTSSCRKPVSFTHISLQRLLTLNQPRAYCTCGSVCIVSFRLYDVPGTFCLERRHFCQVSVWCPFVAACSNIL
jgi:hypothetical protein